VLGQRTNRRPETSCGKLCEGAPAPGTPECFEEALAETPGKPRPAAVPDTVQTLAKRRFGIVDLFRLLRPPRALGRLNWADSAPTRIAREGPECAAKPPFNFEPEIGFAAQSGLPIFSCEVCISTPTGQQQLAFRR
jgi:hypothetical protein